MIRLRPLPASTVFLTLIALLPGQAPRPVRDPAPDTPTVCVSQACGIATEDGTLWGLGPDYKARFLIGGVEFTPALGARAPRNFPLRFQFLGTGRRGDVADPTAAAGNAAPTVSGLRVSYRHAGVTEAYEVRGDGIEQSFVFDRLPEGDGDLVVRLRITSELELQPTAPGTLCFAAAGLGGVRIGAVTGVDARGRRCAGALACADGVLELSLPATFVATAALPLVLDPLVGTTLTVASGFDEEDPDVACVPTGARLDYLVVWARVFSSGDADLRGQRLNYDGSLNGGLIGIRSSTTLSSDMPHVAPVSSRGCFVVVWREIVGANPSTIAACSVDAATGVVSGATQLVSGSDTFSTPDVGGDAADLGDMAVAVWANANQFRIEGARITVAASGAVSASGRTILSGAGTNTAPSIAPDCGRPGLFLIAWTTSTTLSTSINGLVVDRLLTVRDRPILTPATTVRTFAPDVSGDGLHWIIGYERRVDLQTPADLYARWVTFDPVTDAAYTAPEALVDGGSSQQLGASSVLLTGSSLVAWRTVGTNGRTSAYLRSLDQFTCAPCEGFFILEATGTTDIRRVAGAGVYRDAILVWESVDPTTGVGAVRSRRFTVESTGATPFGGTACGPDVQVHGTCPRAGNTNFHLRMEHAEPGRPVFVILREGASFPLPEILCSSNCGFLDPFRGWCLPVGTTDIHGNAALLLPIPAAAVGGLRFQFAVLPAASPGCPGLGLSFSRIATMAVQ